MNMRSGNSRALNSRVLLVHEWYESVGGSEVVFERLREIYPSARSKCLWIADQAKEAAASETWLSKLPLRNKALALPIMPLTWRTTELAEVEKVIVSTHAFAHHYASRAARRGIQSFAYVHTPARYLWAPEVESRGRTPLARMGRIPLRAVDKVSADPRVQYAANSAYVRNRIVRAWGVDAKVIYPPVDVEKITAVERWSEVLREEDRQTLESLPSNFVLGASRMVPYKRLDLAIRVGEELDLPVVIAGKGPSEETLKAQARAARVPVSFVGRVSEELLFALYQASALYAFLPVEDFGIMPVEAMAAGARVLVNASGGASESVAAIGRGAIWSPGGEEGSLKSAATAALESEGSRKALKSFGVERFKREVSAWVDEQDPVDARTPR